MASSIHCFFERLMRKNSLLFFILFFVSFCSFSEPPLAEDVFQMTTKRLDPNTFVLNWQIKPGYFLYKNRIKLNEQTESNVNLAPVQFPKSASKTDRLGKTFPIFRERLTLPVSVLGEQPGESIVDVHYQGCADDGYCYPPEIKRLKLTINSDLGLAAVHLEKTGDEPLLLEEKPMEKPQDEIESVFSSNSLFLIALGFFGFGLLLAFTPCVLPMIPVLSGIIVGHGENITTRKAFFLSCSYVLSMAVTYAVFGAIIATLGSNLQIAMQSPWIISAFSLTFVLLALSMFGFYDLRLPNSFESKLAGITRSQTSGHYLSAAIMGALATLILTPCVTAPLIGALGYIAHTGNIALGTVALFFLGLGMGTPLLLIGASAGKLLPKVGLWMNAVKNFFGVLLLAVALYLMGRILPPVLTMAIWGALLVFCGIYAGALQNDQSKNMQFRQATGIILLVYGILILIGAAMGNTNPLQPLASTSQPYTSKSPAMATVTNMEEVQKTMANTQGKPVLLDFYADWCSSCKVIAATTLQDPRVQEALEKFVVLKVDVTDNNKQSRKVLKHFDVVAPPTFLFFDAQGRELEQLRVVGETHADAFYDRLNQALSAK